MLKHIILHQLFLSLDIILIPLRINSYSVYLLVVLDNTLINKYFNDEKQI